MWAECILFYYNNWDVSWRVTGRLTAFWEFHLQLVTATWSIPCRFFLQLSKTTFTAKHTRLNTRIHMCEHTNTDSVRVLRPGADGGPCGVSGRSFPMAACELHNGNLWATLFVFIYGQVIKSCVVGHRLWIGPPCPSTWCNAHSRESNEAHCSEKSVSSLEWRESICKSKTANLEACS